MIKVGITGLMGAGKTTFANMIKDIRPSSIIRPMAGPLKEIARSMGWNGQKDERGRRLLQLLGTDCGRECINEDIWVNLWKDSIVDLDPEISFLIADDVRFDNEAVAIKEMGGLILRIERPGIIYSVAEPLRHKSEAGISAQYVDEIFYNNGTLGGLLEMVYEFVWRVDK